MYTVLLVDDEKIITKGLSAIIDWKEYGFGKVLYANSASEAIKYAHSQQIDLLITDIRMPNMSGLSLIAALNKDFPLMHKVVLSGYDDFSYAQRSIQLGVDAYLLKPVDREKLIGIAEETVKSIKEEKRSRRESLNHALLESFYHRDSLHGNLKFLEDHYPDFIFLMTQEALEGINVNKSHIYSETLHEKLYLYIVFSTRSQLKELRNSLNEQDEAKPFVYSSIISDHTNLLNFYHEFKIAWMYFEMSHYSNRYKIHHEFSDLEHFDLQDVITIQSQDNLEVDINNSLDTLFANYRQLSTIKISIIRMYISYFEDLHFKKEIDTLEFDRKVHDIFKIMQIVYDRKNLTQYLINAMSDYKKREEVQHPTIIRVQQRIQNDYHQELTLQKLAQDFNMNAAYLGQLIVSECGQSFNELLNNYRLHRAFDLLTYTDKSIKEISSLSGFNDTSYFYRKFKEKYKMTPSQLRGR